jgi:hypothetical protein
MASKKTGARFELAFSPNMRLVATVRRFVNEFYSEVLGDPETTSRLTVASHELLENAVKYAADGSTSIHIDVRPVEGDASTVVTIDTRNRTDAKHVAALRAIIDELSNATDPMAFYQTLMKRSARRPDGSGLGLGRIHAEADMSLTCEIAGDAVTLRAQARIEPRKPS